MSGRGQACRRRVEGRWIPKRAYTPEAAIAWASELSASSGARILAYACPRFAHWHVGRAGRP